MTCPPYAVSEITVVWCTNSLGYMTRFVTGCLETLSTGEVWTPIRTRIPKNSGMTDPLRIEDDAARSRWRLSNLPTFLFLHELYQVQLDISRYFFDNNALEPTTTFDCTNARLRCDY